MATKFIDIDGLAFFKQQLDANLSGQYMSQYDFVGEDGKILNEKLPNEMSIQKATLGDINALFGNDSTDEQTGN